MYVPRDPHEKAMQRALMQYFNPVNHDLVREALKKAGRSDLIGFGKDYLVPPRRISGKGQAFSAERKGGRTDREKAAAYGKKNHRPKGAGHDPMARRRKG